MNATERHVRRYVKRRRHWMRQLGRSALVLGMSCVLPMHGSWARSTLEFVPLLVASEPASSSSSVDRHHLWADVPSDGSGSQATYRYIAASQEPCTAGASPAERYEPGFRARTNDDTHEQPAKKDVRRRLIDVFGIQIERTSDAAPQADQLDQPAPIAQVAAAGQQNMAFVAVENEADEQPVEPARPAVSEMKLRQPDSVARAFAEPPQAVTVPVSSPSAKPAPARTARREVARELTPPPSSSPLPSSSPPPQAIATKGVDLKMLVEAAPSDPAAEQPSDDGSTASQKPDRKLVWSLPTTATESARAKKDKPAEPGRSSRATRRPVIMSVDGDQAAARESTPLPLTSPPKDDSAFAPIVTPEGERVEIRSPIEENERIDRLAAQRRAGGAAEQGSGGVEEQGSRGAGEQGSRGAGRIEVSMSADAPAVEPIPTRVPGSQNRRRPEIVRVDEPAKDPLAGLMTRSRDERSESANQPAPAESADKQFAKIVSPEAYRASERTAARISVPVPPANISPPRENFAPIVSISAADRRVETLTEIPLDRSGPSKIVEMPTDDPAPLAAESSAEPTAEPLAEPTAEPAAIVENTSKARLLFAPIAPEQAEPVRHSLEDLASMPAELEQPAPDLVVEAKPAAQSESGAVAGTLRVPSAPLQISVPIAPPEPTPAAPPPLAAAEPKPLAKPASTPVPTPAAKPAEPKVVVVTHQKVELDLRQSSVVRTAHEIERAEVLDNSICDVVQFAPSELSIIGKREGQTHVRLWLKGQNEAESTNYLVAVGKPEELKVSVDEEYAKLEKTITDLYPKATVQFVESGEKLYVRGTVTSKQEAVGILSLIRRVRLIPVVDQLKIEK